MFERVGGEDFFERVTKRFYDLMEDEIVLRHLYPKDAADYEQARLHLKWFLIQYWGGPSEYDEHRGHPRLRMRHAPFSIGGAERDAWLSCMTTAVKEEGLKPLEESQMIGYLSMAANALVNDSAME